MTPYFSIITPSFRQLEWLRLCAASVADQAEVCVEHIVQDAGTDDLSEVDLLSVVRPSRHVLKLKVEKDNGMYDGINRGLKRAQGEICAYLNCDEQYLPDALSKVQAFFRRRPEIDVLFGDVVLVDQEGSPLSYRRTVLPAAEHLRVSHLNTPSCSTFFRRRLLDRGLFFDPSWKSSGDAAWVISLLQAKVAMHTLPEPLAVFTFTGKNLGASAVSVAENARLRGKSALDFVRAPAAILTHRMRKLISGAYRRRDVEVEIYTLKSPNVRAVQRAKNLGYFWSPP